MPLTETLSRMSTHAVEISGWDIDGIFFVENAEIAGEEQTEKRAKLRRPLRRGAVIFVRRFLQGGVERDCPTPYEVEPLTVDAHGYCEYRLSRVRGRIRPTSRLVN